jgi:hypothetical protein
VATPSRAALAGAALSASLGCSLLAPDDDFFLGGRGATGSSTAGAGATGGSTASTGGAGAPPFETCQPAPPCSELSSAAGVTLTPRAAQDLPGVAATAAAGSTIVLAPGTYKTGGALEIGQPGVTLRSSTGNAADVMIEGASLQTLLKITASDVTIANVTLRGTTESAVVVGAKRGVDIERPRLCGVRIVDAGPNGFVRTVSGGGWVDCGRVEGAWLELTDAARPAHCCPACFAAMLNIRGGRGWVIANNDFRSGFCASVVPPVAPADCGSPPMAVIFHGGARDTVVENNRFVAVARALGIGWGATQVAPRSYPDDPYPGEEIDHYDGVVRNNVIYGHTHCYDTGIEINRAREPVVIHNTVVHPGYIHYAAIDRRYPSTLAFVGNNLVRGGITARQCGLPDCSDQGELIANVQIDALAAHLVDHAALDFHLLPTARRAIDKAVKHAAAGLDIDGEAHTAGAAPDVGADERFP